MVRGRAFALLLGIAALTGCSADQAQRSVYDSLRRYEETRPAPGEDRRALPSYEEYSRTRKGSERG